MEVVWEVDTAEFFRRKRAAKACRTCAKNKKRCVHTFTRPGQSPAQSDISHVIPSSSTPTAASHKNIERDAEQTSRSDSASSRASGVAQVSQPEISSLEQSNEQLLHVDAQASDRISVGVVSSPECIPDNDVRHAHLTEPQRNYLRSVGTFRVLPRATQDVLVTTYIASINGLLPILDSGKLLRQYSSGQASRYLIQAICLVACKTQQAVPYLRLSEKGALLTSIQFARKIYIGLDAAMKADLEPNRVTKIQILALLHLYNDGTYGVEDSSAHLSQAIQLAWALKIHFHWPGRSTEDELSMLWWSLWSLDRFNACISCTPIMIRDRDIQLARPPLGSDHQLQVMAIWFRLGDLLGEVFDLYRPAVAQNLIQWGDEFISFSKLTDGLEARMFQPSHWVALELCFQVVAILSCRYNKPGSVSYKRRITACDRIQTLMSENRHTQLPPLPVIPYAATLSLTGGLCALRDAQKEREIAQKDVAVRSQILEKLSSCWQNAEVVAKLGRVALRSLKKPSARAQDFTNLLTGIDADTEASRDAFNGRAGAAKFTRAGIMTPGTSADTDDDLNATDPVSNEEVELTVAQSVQTSEVPQDFNPEAPVYSNPGTYLSQTTRQHIPPAFPPTTAPAGYDFPTLFGSAEYNQGFDQHSFFEGFFDLGMPTSLQDVMSDGTLFLNEVFDDSSSVDSYARQLQEF